MQRRGYFRDDFLSPFEDALKDSITISALLIKSESATKHFHFLVWLQPLNTTGKTSSD